MAKLIMTSRYLRNTPKRNAANLVRYMGTREGVERISVAEKPAPATVRQQRLIKDLLKAGADARYYLEYRDYENDPTKQNATDFIDAFVERNAEQIAEIDKLVKYMAERPGVEKLGPHGLFSQTDDRIDLDSVAEEVGQHQGIVWTHVISLHREDAERLGYNNANAWKDLVRRNVTELAKAHNIVADQLQWYGAFHNTTHHPHMHLVVYSKDPRQGWLSKKGIDELHSFFGNDIFRFEQQKLFRMETELRDKLKDQVDYELAQQTVSAAREYEPTPEAVMLIQKLRVQLKKHNGKKVYGYLPKEIKATVDQIVASLAKDEGIAQLYKEWNKVNREKLSLYREKKEPDLPLEDNTEFRSIKNKIIQAVLSLPLPESCDPTQEPGAQASDAERSYAAQAAKMGQSFYPQQATVSQGTQVTQVTQDTAAETGTQTEPSAESIPMTYVFNEDYTQAVKVPACMPSALKGVAFALAQMLADGQHRKLSKLRGQVDHKLRSKIEQKKAAHGLKTDHSAQNQGWDQSL